MAAAMLHRAGGGCQAGKAAWRSNCALCPAGASGSPSPMHAPASAEPSAALPHEPFIPASVVMREFTWRAVITGTILGIIFGASSLYLVLKVGITVSASIPVAVIALALFRGLSKLGARDSTILENNITQTAGSAGESIAFGVGVTMPAILILGFDLEVSARAARGRSGRPASAS